MLGVRERTSEKSISDRIFMEKFLLIIMLGVWFQSSYIYLHSFFPCGLILWKFLISSRIVLSDVTKSRDKPFLSPWSHSEELQFLLKVNIIVRRL